jgi:hypothetical protein
MADLRIERALEKARSHPEKIREIVLPNLCKVDVRLLNALSELDNEDIFPRFCGGCQYRIGAFFMVLRSVPLELEHVR